MTVRIVQSFIDDKMRIYDQFGEGDPYTGRRTGMLREPMREAETMLDNPTWYAPIEAPAETRPRTPQESLLAAARFIEQHGHSQTGHEQAQDRYCAIEAIAQVTEYQQAAIDLLMDHIRHIEPIGITYWNARTSEDEVVATMREAANEERE